jgi:hypothetical protein
VAVAADAASSSWGIQTRACSLRFLGEPGLGRSCRQGVDQGTGFARVDPLQRLQRPDFA